MQSENNKNTIGAVLVIGGGVSGVQSALDLAESGFKVYLVEKGMSIGGVMAQLDKTFPTNDCSMCILAPKLVDTGRHQNIKILTNSEVTKIEGDEGKFKITVNQKPRYVKVGVCTACGDCEKVCPINIKNKYDEYLSDAKAIHKAFAQSIPNANFVEKRGTAPCKSACPIDTSAQGYVALIRQGKIEEAYQLIRSVNPLPAVCGRVCHHPCEQNCQRGDVDEPISIAGLKRFAVDWVTENGLRKPPENPAKGTKQKKIAIIGSGPAGLACGHDLALKGYSPFIYEALPRAGGMLAIGIPDYRLPVKVLEAEIDEIKQTGVEIKLNSPIGKNSDLTLDKLIEENDAVFISVGAQISKKLGIEGEDVKGVSHAIDFLRELNLGIKPYVGKKVAVVGGGNAAIDAARTAQRLGAEKVMIVYRRTRKEMPANAAEVDAAEKEGIDLIYLTAPVRVISEKGNVTGLECIKMELGSPDSSGRRRPVPVEGSNFIIETDQIIPAISQEADLGFTGGKFDLTKWGTFKVDNCFRTNIQKVFAGGDAVTGPDTVIEAISAGKKAAIHIDQFLSDTEIKPIPKKDKTHYTFETKKIYAPRVHQNELPIEVRIKNFEEVETGYTLEKAQAEASRCLECGICSECYECVKACKAGAIDHEMKAEELVLDIGAVVLAPGFDEFNPKILEEYGYGRYPNVVTSIEFERIMGATGPFLGHIKRLSDHKTPKKIAFLQCIGSRDERCGREYCSSVCCMYATKEAVIAKEHCKLDGGLDTTIFIMDMRAYGKGFDQYYERAKKQYGVKYIRSRVSKIEEDSETKNPILYYESENGEFNKEQFDMVVLSVGLDSPSDAKNLAETFNLKLNRYGYNDISEFEPVATARRGVFVAGAFAGPKDIPETVMQASAAAAEVARVLSPARHTLVTQKEYPAEIDVVGELPRVGVFVCHCGVNIGGIVDVPAVLEYAKTLPYVVYAERNIYTCAQDTQQIMINKIKEHGINRVVVASCSPRTHEPLFQQTIREAGLNPYLFEMANIRDQCSWVHMDEPEAATQKSKDLVRMAVEKAIYLEPLSRQKVGVTYAALVVGGGIAGMTSALNLADQGYEVAIVERENSLGGNLNQIHESIDGKDVSKFLKESVQKIYGNPKIKVFLNSTVSEVEGFIGNYQSKIENKTSGEEIIFKHGVAIVAVGGKETNPQSVKNNYSYGKHQSIITQREFEELLYSTTSDEIKSSKNFVMIQCVGSRDDERPYCSRICCIEAVKNAIKLKKKNPSANVFVFYRDIRTYGFSELYYAEVRNLGVIFIRFEKENPPRIEIKDNKVYVVGFEMILERPIRIPADKVILSMGVSSYEENVELAKKLKVPLDASGFFLEAHMKLRPVDFATDGVYLCGMAHAPKTIEESIAQAKAAAARAGIVLSQTYLETEALISRIDPNKCKLCGLCIEMCPYKAIDVNKKGTAAEVNPALCKGCGVCVTSCRCGAPNLAGFSNEAIVSQIEALMSE